MTIQSLGVGSGLALDDLVTQLLSAEREPKEKRLNDKEEKISKIFHIPGNLSSAFLGRIILEVEGFD